MKYILVLVGTFLLAGFICIMSVPKTEEKIFIKDIQITSQGKVIISTQEEETKREGVMILEDRNIQGRIYAGNVKIIKKGCKYSFQSLDF